MSLQEKFAALTVEQQSKFRAVKDETELNALLKELGAELNANEREEAMRLINPIQSELSDDELENVSGGCNVAWSGITTVVPKCPVCGGEKLSPTLNTTPNFGTSAFYVCDGCGESGITLGKAESV